MNPFVILLGGQRCAVGSRDLLNLYTNCPLLSRPPVNQLDDAGSNPAQGIKSFSPNENVFQGLSVLGHFKLH